MTEDELKASLKPCPFCGAGETRVDEKYLWQGGLRPSQLTAVVIRHWCDKLPGQIQNHIEFRGRDHESAQIAWNRRIAP